MAVEGCPLGHHRFLIIAVVHFILVAIMAEILKLNVPLSMSRSLSFICLLLFYLFLKTFWHFDIRFCKFKSLIYIASRVPVSIRMTGYLDWTLSLYNKLPGLRQDGDAKGRESGQILGPSRDRWEVQLATLMDACHTAVPSQRDLFVWRKRLSLKTYIEHFMHEHEQQHSLLSLVLQDKS